MFNCECGCGNRLFITRDGNGATCVHTARPTTGQSNKELMKALIDMGAPIEVQMEMTDEQKIDFCERLLDGVATVIPK
jgi:hypothetical protein